MLWYDRALLAALAGLALVSARRAWCQDEPGNAAVQLSLAAYGLLLSLR